MIKSPESVELSLSAKGGCALPNTNKFMDVILGCSSPLSAIPDGKKHSVFFLFFFSGQHQK